MEERARKLYSAPLPESIVLEVRTPEEFRAGVIEADAPTVAMFWATWCPFCRRFKPTFDKIAATKPWRFASVTLDDESNPLWDEYAVDVVPTLALFRQGNVAERVDGILGYGIDPPMVEEFVRRVSATLK
jgi:thioredoxin 1